MLIKLILNDADFETSLKHRRIAALGLLAVGLVGLGCYFLLVADSALPDFTRGFYLGAAAGITAGALILFLRSQSERSFGLRELVLGEDPLELVMCRETDPAPGQEAVPIQALRDAPLCLLRSDDLWGYSRDLLGECRRAGFTPNVACQCYDTPMEMQMVQAGFGVGFLPRSVVAAHPGSPLYTKPVLGFTTKSYPILVWEEDPYQSGCVKRFLELAGEKKL